MAATSVSAFGQELLTEWRASHAADSIVFSPLSIVLCFLLLYPASQNQTKNEFDSLFGFDDSAAVATLTDKSASVEGSGVDIANRIYVDATVNLDPDYVAAVGKTSVAETDFLNDASGATTEINDWVSGATRGLIPNLIPAGALTSDTRLVALSALYFLGNWVAPFPPEATKDDAFYGVNGEQTAPFMRLDYERLPYRRVENLASDLVGLPYKGGRYTLYVLLPDKRDGWKGVEKSLPGYIDRLFAEQIPRKRIESLRMPRWEMEFNFEGLVSSLEQLGFTTAFTSAADFGGMTVDKERLAISDVLHKARIRVDEKGTEAAAATGIAVVATSAVRDPVYVTVDRPFLYFILDETDRTILFQGTQTTIP